MPVWFIPVISAAGALAFLFVLMFVLAAVGYNSAFGRRYDKNPVLKYFTAEDFRLETEPVAVQYKKRTLRGYIYRDGKVGERDTIVVFAHGMGAGQVEYTTEIAYFCRQGYVTLALDVTGCNFSDGSKIAGMYSGVTAVKCAADFARKTFPGRKICLVGHSWGGYSVLCASAERKVEKVVAISAPDTPVKTIYFAAARMISQPLAAALCPFWRLLNFLKFGTKGNLSAAKSASGNNTPTLLIHGGKDKIVSRKNAVYYRAEGDNLTKVFDTEKAHNPYNTPAAERLLSELSSTFVSKELTAAEKRAFAEKFDYSAATEEDGKLMTAISDFIAENN